MCYYNSISINKVNKFYEDVKKSLNKKKGCRFKWQPLCEWYLQLFVRHIVCEIFVADAYHFFKHISCD